MKTILVSGASGIVGYGILRSLRKSNSNYKLIGTSIYDDSVAQVFSDVFIRAPHTDSPQYLDWLLEVINTEKIDLLIPSIEIDMYKWVESYDLILQTGAKMVVNNIELIRLCNDKWVFYEKLVASEIESRIDSSISGNFSVLKAKYGLPFLLKPRKGYAARGIVKVSCEGDFLKHEEYFGKILMAQPIIGTDDEEYSVSAFCDGLGGFTSIMMLKRKLAREGFTEKAEVVDSLEIRNQIRILCNLFKPLGPTNFQFRKHNNGFKLLEINPRISSSTSIRTAFGYNESEMSVDFYLEKKMPSQPPIKQGKAIRYIEDLILYK